MLLFEIFCGCIGFRHRTESDLFLFLLTAKRHKSHQLYCSLHNYFSQMFRLPLRVGIKSPSEGLASVLYLRSDGLWMWHFTTYSFQIKNIVPCSYMHDLLCSNLRRLQLTKQEILTPSGHLVYLCSQRVLQCSNMLFVSEWECISLLYLTFQFIF